MRPVMRRRTGPGRSVVVWPPRVGHATAGKRAHGRRPRATHLPGRCPHGQTCDASSRSAVDCANRRLVRSNVGSDTGAWSRAPWPAPKSDGGGRPRAGVDSAAAGPSRPPGARTPRSIRGPPRCRSCRYVVRPRGVAVRRGDDLEARDVGMRRASAVDPRGPPRREQVADTCRQCGPSGHRIDAGDGEHVGMRAPVVLFGRTAYAAPGRPAIPRSPRWGRTGRAWPLSRSTTAMSPSGAGRRPKAESAHRADERCREATRTGAAHARSLGGGAGANAPKAAAGRATTSR